MSKYNPERNTGCATRTPTLMVACVKNSKGYHVNVSLGGLPSFTLGPFEDEVPLLQALVLVATELRMDDRGINLTYS
jgi:hypothetical protein